MLSIVIPTYGRDQVLCDTVGYLLALGAPADEIVIVDQTPDHAIQTKEALARWHESGSIRWLRHDPPGTVRAMNHGTVEAQGDVILFLDDDIVPGEGLVERHRQAHEAHPDAWAVVGQVLQPEDWQEGDRPENGEGAMERGRGRVANGAGLREPAVSVPESGCVGPGRPQADQLTEDLGFAFNGGTSAWVSNVMAGNLSVRRDRFLALGGFDANFTPPVSFRFETEFAKRLVRNGGRVWFEPSASIRHFRATRGGTRSQGSHLTSTSPVHGVGDYYYALRCGRGWQRTWYMAKRPFREVRTRFHLRHPWWIPVKFIGELRALLLAAKLFRGGPRLLVEAGSGASGPGERHA